MSKPKEITDHERALRIELSKRSINMISRDDDGRILARDPEHIEQVGKEISKLIYEERLEQAQKRLREELAEYPDEMGLLSLQMILNVLNRPHEGYDRAKKVGDRLMELAVESSNSYYAMVAINNLALIAHNEGHHEFSKAMYFAAHLIDRKALGPMRNLAGWYSRRGMLNDAHKWIERIFKAFPDWQKRDDIITFLQKDESLHNLRSSNTFKENVLSKITGTMD